MHNPIRRPLSATQHFRRWPCVATLLLALGGNAAFAQTSLPDCAVTETIGSVELYADPNGYNIYFDAPQDGGVQLFYSLPMPPGMEFAPRLVPEVRRTQGGYWPFEGRELQVVFQYSGGLFGSSERTMTAEADVEDNNRVAAYIVDGENRTDSGDEIFDVLVNTFAAGKPIRVGFADATTGEVIVEREFIAERLGDAIARGEAQYAQQLDLFDNDGCRFY